MGHVPKTKTGKAERREGWVTFQATVDGEDALVSVDSSAEQRREAVRLLQLKVLIGLDGDLDDLSRLLDAMASAVRKSDVSVGRILRTSTCVVYFYTSSPDRLLKRLHKSLDDRWHEIEVAVSDDVDWIHYWNVLCTNQLGWAYIDNRRLQEMLAAHGDIHEKPRAVDHHAVFRTEARARQFVGVLSQRGYSPEDVAKEESGWGCRFRGTHADSMPEINDVTYSLVRLAQEFGGSYDGWGCRVVR
jgi:hypothetical protein